MGIESWTDVEYAQAAIDMLPGTVEEIKAFLRREGITGRRMSGTMCPIARWVQKWTGREDSYMGNYNFYPCGYPSGPEFPVSNAVTQFVWDFDSGRISL